MKLQDVIVGGCVYSLLRSHLYKVPVVMPEHKQPSIDMTFESEMTFENLVTKRHCDAWSMLKFLCAMQGLIVNPFDLEYVRIEGDTLTSKGINIQFKKCHLFPHSVVKTDLETSRIEHENCYKIVDFMRLKFCDASNLVSIFPKEGFISRIESIGKKEMYAVSYLQKEQLTNFDYSDTMVRFMVQKMIENNDGVHRPLVSKDREVRRKPKLEVTERKVLPMEEVVYENSKRVKFYDRKKRSNIIKAYRRHCASVQGAV